MARLFQIGARGVNVTDKPQDLDFTELSSAQNAEINPSGGQGALDQRPGMSRINSAPLPDEIVAIHNVTSDLDSDFTEMLIASRADSGSWRTSFNGSTWSSTAVPADPHHASTSITVNPFRYTKVVALDRKLYYFEDSTPIVLRVFDGTTDKALAPIPPASIGTTLATPPAPIISYTGERNPMLAPSAPSINYSGVLLPLVTPSAPTLSGSGSGGDSYDLKYKIVNTYGSNVSAPSSEVSITVKTRSCTITSNQTTYARKVYRTQLDANNNPGDYGYIGTISAGSTTLVDSGFISADGNLPSASATSASSYSYKIVAVGGHGAYSAASGASSTTAAVGTLTSSDKVVITAPSTANVDHYDVYRTAGGSTQGKIGEVDPGNTLSDTGLAGDGATAPSAASPASGTTYTYKIVAIAADGSNSIASSGANSANSYSTLSATDYATITVPSPPVAGAASYDVYRTVGGLSQGKIGNIPVSGGTMFLNDIGLNGDTLSAPASASGTAATDALAVFDMITDGTNIIVSVLDDPSSDPDPIGRILYYSPSSGIWSQIGAPFPHGSENGTAAPLCMFQGTLHYGTYTGATTGNTAVLNSTNWPLPSGGQTVVFTTPTSASPCCMAVFNGRLYAGTVSVVSGTAGRVYQLDEDGQSWTSVLTASDTDPMNGFTSLYVHGGKLYAGQVLTSGAGSQDSWLISSSIDGSTWSSEVGESTFAHDGLAIGQMATFKNDLYVVLTQVGASAFDTRIIQLSEGIWSSAISSSSIDFGGGLAVMHVDV